MVYKLRVRTGRRDGPGEAGANGVSSAATACGSLAFQRRAQSVQFLHTFARERVTSQSWRDSMGAWVSACFSLLHDFLSVFFARTLVSTSQQIIEYERKQRD